MQTPETYVLISRLVLAGVLGGMGVFSLRAADEVSDVPSAGFLTQAELDARLDTLKKSTPPWIGYIHRDRCHNSTGKFVPYAYKCPTCGRCTMYEHEIGIRCQPSASYLVAWARESVAKLRNLRLDVKVDERGLCDHCRIQLKVPDGGRIVHIPDDWPEREKMGSFPFQIGDEVHIRSEPYDNIYCISRKTQPYWVPAEYVTKDWNLTDAALLPVRVGPGEQFCKIYQTNRSHPGRVVPNSETNGWVRYDGDFPMEISVPKETVEVLTFAGERTMRYDVKKLRWTINGMAADVSDETDVLILATFLKGELKLPNWQGPDSDIRSISHMQRLEKLLHPLDNKNVWRPFRPLPKQTELRAYTNHSNDWIEIEVDI